MGNLKAKRKFGQNKMEKKKKKKKDETQIELFGHNV